MKKHRLHGIKHIALIVCFILIIASFSAATIPPNKNKNRSHYKETKRLNNGNVKTPDKSGAFPQIERKEQESGFAPGNIIIKFKPGIDVSNSSRALEEIKKLSDPSFAAVLSAKPVFSQTILAENAEKKSKIGLDRWVSLEVDNDIDILNEVEKYKNTEAVDYAQPNFIYSLFYIPNDPYFNEQWALHNTGQTGGTPDADIDAPEAWDIETGDSDVVIAVVDTGVDYDHPDLADNIWINEDEIPDNSIDDDGNGFVDDIRGWDFYNDDNDPMDDHGHGTHCSGIAAGVGNNSVGITGVCWNCSIMPVKGISSGGSGTDVSLSNAIYYAADNDADIISCSWGGYLFSQLLKDAMDYAAQSCIVVAAAGNELNWVSYHKPYPAGFENTFAIAFTDHNDKKADFLNWGSNWGFYYDAWIDVSAPGVDIKSTLWDNTYDSWSGSSMATPMVAGVAALVKSHHPSWSNNQVMGQVLSTADDIDTLNPGYETLLGSGRINAYNAVANTISRQPSMVYKQYTIDDPEPGGNNNGYLEPGETANLCITLRNNGFNATNIEGALSTSHPQVTIVSSTAAFGDISTLNSSTGCFLIALNSDASRRQYIDFSLTVSDSGSYVETFPIKVEVSNPYQTGWPYIEIVHPYVTSQSINIADLNGDGAQELLLSMFEKVYAWDPHGETFDGWPVSGSNNWKGVSLGDLNGDGCLEVVFIDQDRYIHIYNYMGQEIANKPLENISTGSPTLADIDNDGELEIVVGAMQWIHAFNLDGSDVSGFPVDLLQITEDLRGLAVGDVNSDGTLETVASGDMGVVVLSNSGDILYEWQQGSHSPPTLADIDNDGELEIIVSTDNGVSIRHYDGTEIFNKTIAGQVAVGDIDNDGYPDIVVSVQSKVYAKVYAWDHQGRIIEGDWPVNIPYLCKIVGRPVLADIDGDNNVEIILSGYTHFQNSTLYAFNGDGSVVTGFPLIEGYGDGEYVYGTPTVADIDGDGDVEIATYFLLHHMTWGVILKTVVYDLSCPFNKNRAPWPMLQHDPQRTGVYSPSKIFVDDDNTVGPWDGTPDHPYQFIQDGVNNANSSDVVFVLNGTYYENVVVDKSIYLVAEDKETTTIDIGGSEACINISHDWVSIFGFTVQNSNDCGIYINSNYNIISRNNITSNSYGIYLEDSSSYNTIIGNNITNNNHGIYTYLSNNKISGNNCIYHNNFINNNQGAHESCINIWDDSYPSGGNYWSGYMGEDNYCGPDQDVPGADGIGDIPHNISGGNDQDQYPLISPWNGTSPVPSLDIVYVDDDFDENTPGLGWAYFDKIQDGIEAVDEHGMVFVSNGTYYENIINFKSINLIGEDKSNTVIDGGGSGDVFYIRAILMNITGFTIKNSGNNYTGIFMYYSISNVISGNNIVNNEYGIYLHRSYDNTINGNTIINNKYGVHLNRSNKNTINENTIVNNEYGIYLFVSDENNIIENSISSNDDRGIYLSGYLDDHYMILSSDYNIISGNNIADNNYGIYLEWLSRFNTITKNNILNNTIGFYTDNSTFPSVNNFIYHNNFLGDDLQHAYDSGINNYDEGNYWEGHPTNPVWPPGLDIAPNGRSMYPPKEIDGGNNIDEYPWYEVDGWFKCYGPDCPEGKKQEPGPQPHP